MPFMSPFPKSPTTARQEQALPVHAVINPHWRFFAKLSIFFSFAACKAREKKWKNPAPERPRLVFKINKSLYFVNISSEKKGFQALMHPESPLVGLLVGNHAPGREARVAVFLGEVRPFRRQDVRVDVDLEHARRVR